jgi:hypothetical protein
MNQTAVVTLGAQQTITLHKSGNRLTKKWLRDYLRDNAGTDFILRNTAGPLARWCGKPISGRDGAERGLTFEVHDSQGRHVASVEWQIGDGATLQAVVR